MDKPALIAEITQLYKATVEELDKLPRHEPEGVTFDSFDARASLQDAGLFLAQLAPRREPKLSERL